MRIFCLCFTACLAFLAGPIQADDWPQWLGPRRDSVWREEGIVKRFPDSGLSVGWRVPVGLGYGGPAVAGGRVFLMDYKKRSGEATNNPGGQDKFEGHERILCFDVETGRLLWKHEYDRPYNISYPRGPRCTPTVAGGKVYALGAEGNLTCLDADNGDLHWEKDLVKEYKSETPFWGFAAHPLVDGDTLYCVVGGEGSVAVAFNKDTGEEIWRALSAPEPGYCPPTMIEHAGVRQLLIWHVNSINSLNPRTGEVYWSIPLKPDYRMSIAAPRKLGDSLFAGGIGNVAALIKLDNNKPAAEVAWRGTASTAVYPANSTPFLAGGTIYGCDCRSGTLMGVRLSDGKRLWQTFQPTSGQPRAQHGTAFIVRHKDRYFLMSETGDLILANLSPEGYEELDRFHVLEPTNEAFGRDVVWSHPAFAHKSLFARNDKELVRINLAADE